MGAVLMYGVANCTASILRGTSVNEYGDPVDDPAGAPVATNVPAQVLVRNYFTVPQGETTPRTVQRLTGTISSGTDIRKNDLLRDDTHAITYVVRSVTQANGIGYQPDLELELDRLT